MYFNPKLNAFMILFTLVGSERPSTQPRNALKAPSGLEEEDKIRREKIRAK